MNQTTNDTLNDELDKLISARSSKHKRKEQMTALATVLIPTLGVVATVMLAFKGIGGGAPEWLLLIGMHILGMIGVEIGYHRCFTHKAFVPNKALTFILAVLGTWTMQGPPMWWASVHRRHHSNTDQDGDPHTPHGGVISKDLSPLKRFLHSHTLWLFNHDSITTEKMMTHCKDLYKNSVLFNVNINYWWWAFTGIIVPTLILGLYYMSLEGALLGFLWGGLTRVFIGHHAFWALNSVCHTFGSRPFETHDQSTNNVVVAIATLGQGWHNNHHAFPSSAKVGLRWWEFDPGWFFIQAFKVLGMASDVRIPTKTRIVSKLRNP